MELVEFRSFFDSNVEKLEKAKDVLVLLINKALKQYQDQLLFRPRLVEARVKDPQSLWNKMNIKGYDFLRVFELGYIPDIIGARIVCHNLSDIENIYNCIDEESNLKIMASKEKNVHESCHIGDPESGYRSLHRKVRWKYKNDDYQAELQIRTILQDAWAQFMHDDIYEHGVREGISKHLLASLKHGSDLLYSLDLLAENLRKYVSESREIGVSLQKIYQQGLFGMYQWTDSNLETPNYESIERNDFYKVIKSDGIYSIEVNGYLKDKAEKFEIPISGDTEAKTNAKISKFIDKTKNKNLLDVRSSHYISFNETRSEKNKIVTLGHNRKRKNHKYKIVCKWKGTFGQNFEYIHIPWKSYYKTKGRYSISIEHDKELILFPTLFTYDDFNEVITIFERKGEVPSEMGTQLNRDNNIYSCLLEQIDENYIVVWISQ